MKPSRVLLVLITAAAIGVSSLPAWTADCDAACRAAQKSKCNKKAAKQYVQTKGYPKPNKRGYAIKYGCVFRVKKI